MSDLAIWLAAEKYQRLYDDIVHNLRSQGWSREDAIFAADEKIARWMAQDLAFAAATGDSDAFLDDAVAKTPKE